MYWKEVPFRAAGVARVLMQRCGIGTADRVPAPAADARYGGCWVAQPDEPSGAMQAIKAAQALCAGQWSAFGHSVSFSNGLPDWNRDPVTSALIPLGFGLAIDFRHLRGGVDIKFLWELNRHVWWVTLARAWAIGRDPELLHHIGRLIESWLTACPYALGANWSSPVEHGIRLINWSLVWHLIGGERSPLFDGESGHQLEQRWLAVIYQHMQFASDNYSFYSSADNHLIGEAAGVFVAGHTWDCWVQGRQMRDRAKEILQDEALKQFSPDGVNREQAICYQKFTLQFLMAAGLCGRASNDDFTPAVWSRLESSVTFLGSMIDVAGQLPSFGDSDDGEVWDLAPGAGVSSYLAMVALGAHLFRRPDLMDKCRRVDSRVVGHVAWVLGPAPVDTGEGTNSRSDVAALSLPKYFPDGGYAILGHRLHAPGELRVLMDCGPLGYNRIGGHGHADALAITVSCDGEQLLVDPGTYCYNAEPSMRRYFRGTSAHNTVMVDGLDQSDYGASFLWLRDVDCTIVSYLGAGGGSLHAWHSGYLGLADPVRHHRELRVDDDGTIVVDDWLECREHHRVTMSWHGAIGTMIHQQSHAAVWWVEGKRFALEMRIEGVVARPRVVQAETDPPQGWVSPAFYVRAGAPALVVAGELAPMARISTRMRVVARATASEDVQS